MRLDLIQHIEYWFFVLEIDISTYHCFFDRLFCVFRVLQRSDKIFRVFQVQMFKGYLVRHFVIPFWFIAFQILMVICQNSENVTTTTLLQNTSAPLVTTVESDTESHTLSTAQDSDCANHKVYIQFVFEKILFCDPVQTTN